MDSREDQGRSGYEGGQKTETARAAAGQVASSAKDQARSFADEARSEAEHVTGDIRGRLQEEAQDQTRRASENLREWSEDLSAMADQGRPQSPMKDVVRQVAQSGRGAADYLDERGVDGLVDEVREFARRKPVAFLAGAAMAGFAIGRVLKVSSATSGQAQHAGGRSETGPAEERASLPQPRQGTPTGGDVPPFHQPATARQEDSVPPMPGNPERPGGTPSGEGG